MRGKAPDQSSMLCLLSAESRVPKNHPLRDVKRLADDALKRLTHLFDQMYSQTGRPSIPPETLLKSMLLMALYSVRSERQFCEQLDYNLLYRWFLDMDMVQDSFDPTVFTKNRDRLIEHEATGQFLQAVVTQAREAGLVSDEHFSVDGTLIEAWASMKSFRPKDEDDSDDDNGQGPPSNRWVDFRGEKRSNETHESKTDPEAKLTRKGNGREAKLCFSAHALMENRHGLVVDFRVDQATGTAERSMALDMLQTNVRSQRATVGGDKNYDTKQFVADCREMNITPHVAQNSHARRRSAIDGRVTSKRGYSISQRLRMRIEEIFGWMKTVGNFRRTRYRGVSRTQLAAYMVAASFNLLRIARLLSTA